MPRAFVLMPFAAEFSEIYNLFIARALDNAGFEVFRADDIINQQNILQGIVSSIASSDLIIADLTGSNPNVYYELGIAHALGKPVVLLTQSIDELPFDLRSYRVVSYNTHFAAIQKAESELGRLAAGVLDGSVAFGSPVRDFLHDSATGEKMALAIGGTSGDDVGELGLIDHLVSIEESFEQLSEVLQQINEGVESMTSNVGQATDRLNEADANSGSGSTRHKQKIMRKLAESQDAFALSLAAYNKRYSEVLSGIENSLESVVGAASADTEEESEQLEEFLQTLSETEDSAFGAQQTYLSLATTIDQLPNIERHLTRANQRVGREVRQLAEVIDQTVAIVSRARSVGERILKGRAPAVQS